MLTIRAAQFEAMRRQRRDAFLQRACRTIHELLAAAGRPADPGFLLPRVQAGIARALAFQLLSEHDIIDYLKAGFLYCDGFQFPHPTIQEIAFLSTGGLPSDRVQRFSRWARSAWESKGQINHGQ
ncbi:MAG TPA: hypothetical protein VFQ91_08310 [Bryobacteraceae bacterium]|nr:hypothetical protein [Bryobacteraceae bacterium]